MLLYSYYVVVKTYFNFECWLQFLKTTFTLQVFIWFYLFICSFLIQDFMQDLAQIISTNQKEFMIGRRSFYNTRKLLNILITPITYIPDVISWHRECVWQSGGTITIKWKKNTFVMIILDQISICCQCSFAFSNFRFGVTLTLKVLLTKVFSSCHHEHPEPIC